MPYIYEAHLASTKGAQLLVIEKYVEAYKRRYKIRDANTAMVYQLATGSKVNDELNALTNATIRKMHSQSICIHKQFADQMAGQEKILALLYALRLRDESEATNTSTV